MGDDSIARRGWIKLEIPCSIRSRMGSIISCQEDKMFPALQEYGIWVLSKSPVRLVEEQDCDPYYEINFEVNSKEFNENLLKAIRKYFDDLAKDGLVPFQRGNLVLHTSDFWSSSLTCHEPDIPLAALYWGNIQGGTFINHWEVSFWDDIMRRMNQSKNEDIRAADRNGINQIFVDFEFDKTDLITVNLKQFESIEVSDQTRRQRQEVLCFYQITVKRTQIRRIILDPVVCDVYGTQRYRIHFELNAPVLIRRGFFTKEKQANQKHQLPIFRRRLTINRGRASKQYPTSAAISDSPVFTIEFDQCVPEKTIYTILSRLRFRTGVSIEFASMPSIDCLIWKENPYHRWTFKQDGSQLSPTDYEAPVYRDFIEAAFPKRNEVCGSREIDTNRERKFSITYLIECLLSRGAVVKDQVLLDEKVWHRFLEVVLHYYSRDDRLCEAGLEDLVHMIDGRKRIGSIIKCFDTICQTREKNRIINGLTQEEMREGYQRVRKLIFTPTRVIYVAPETLMGNRVLRRYDHDGTRVLRITFRDDDNMKMRTSKTSSAILEKTVEKYLRDGIKVAGRCFGYLGSSNSQMRDNGAYFMEKYSSSHYRDYVRDHGCDPPVDFIPKIQDARKNLGKFEKIDNIPKMMARLGQCFTQSRLSGVNLERHTYLTMFDLIGGKNSKGNEYTFSDGVGLMSRIFAEKVSQVLDFGKGVPSCFQFRFRGMKGVIAIEPLLDEIRRWAALNKLPNISRDLSWGVNCVFRPSQIKFISKRHPRDQVEIVKYSSPVPVALNKPFINILDQVSEMQSLECHRRVTNRIEELLDRQMLLFAQQMVDETQCRNRLKELPRRIDIDFLKTTWGFTLSSEPFFRSLIKASIKFSITRQLRKEQIPIPHELGRSMLGVVDETGRLQYGQIFVQYTKNLALKLPPPSAAKEVLTGKVLLTKNPCIVAGDVRVFEAVDIPELHHMVDVVVFPQNGPRPHPDEMAGSDLDGDEYSIIWDQDMLLDHNETPFDFTAEKQKVAFDESKIDELMREFYVRYLELDSVGTISNNHLHCSDQYGLNAKVCMDLAKKNCQAVDFTKSGQAPEPLRVAWTEDSETGEWLPPERAERVPDYHMGNDHSPVYVSPRLCGKLFREFKAIDDVLKISEERDEQLEIPIDETIIVAGYDEFMPRAREELARYNAQLRSIMENYGIRTEGEIFSGCIADMRNRISDKDQDDMSFYNTNQMIETKITNLFKKYREEFFEEFDGSWQKHTEPTQRCNDEANIIQRQCKNPTTEIMKKAVAWYRACYEEARHTRENKKLSFAWIVYDIIGIIKQNVTLDDDDAVMGGENPLFPVLKNHRDQYIKDNRDAFSQFKHFDFLNELRGKAKLAGDIINLYFTTYPGLDEIVFLLCEWADAAKLFDQGPLQKHHFILLFILFATKQFASVDGNANAYIEQINENSIDINDVIPDDEKSRMMIKFLEFLASRRFRKLSFLSYKAIKFDSIFMRGEWQIFHVAALKTYYNILFNLRFEELPVSTDPEITVRTIIRENEPFVIELPSSCSLNEVLIKLKQFTGVEEISMRPMEKSRGEMKKENIRLLVSTRGTLESMYKLRQLVAVKVPIKTYVTVREISTQLARLCYEKIISGTFNT
ncbi:unnamed protein product [Caenorhabditis angaria]|uniref:RNA-directed RNA polymerase n=1 Tax=Caenorhabditis angaria TaxID=860376 RepID=A0A9P1MSW4_9PELO|nr:unnamed protein product [Caenorhabditis angaria]